MLLYHWYCMYHTGVTGTGMEPQLQLAQVHVIVWAATWLRAGEDTLPLEGAQIDVGGKDCYECGRLCTNMTITVIDNVSKRMKSKALLSMCGCLRWSLYHGTLYLEVTAIKHLETKCP